MMLPSLVPMLWRYREAVTTVGETRLGLLTALVGVGYFFVWTVISIAAYALGVALAEMAMRQPALSRGVPIAVGMVVLIAGAYQFTAREGASPGLLPRRARPRPNVIGGRRHRLATRRAPRHLPQLQGC
jgi:predicted metal-binding membrane protein